MNLYVGFDDVLVKTSCMLVYQLNKCFNDNKSIDDIWDWKCKHAFPKATENLVNSIFNTKKFFEIAQPMEDLYKFTKLMNKHNSCVISAGGYDNLKYKTQYIYNTLKLKCTVRLMNAMSVNNYIDKPCINMKHGVFIDRDIRALRMSNANFKILFMPYGDKSWDRYDNLDNVYVSHTLSEIIDIINFIDEYEEFFL